MSYKHKFHLLNSDELPIENYWRTLELEARVGIEDELLRYMYASIVWIPTLNPTGGAPCRGLCMHGITAITPMGASIAAKIFGGWATIFECSSDILSLSIRGAHLFDEHRSFELARNNIVENLRTLVRYLEIVANDEKFYVIHHGI